MADDPGILPDDPAVPGADGGWRGRVGIGGVNILNAGCPIPKDEG